MKVGVREVAKLLEVSEKTIYRWISQRKIPVHRVNDQYRFNRAEVLEWATTERIPISPWLLAEEDDAPLPLLHEALRTGGVYYRVDGLDTSTVLRNVVALMPLPEEVDRDFLYQVLLARESIGSTGIGDGIAVPHARNPIVMHIVRPMISLCFLENAIDFKAIDGKPVNTLFTIVSPSSRAHLQLLSKLMFCLRKKPFFKSINEECSREKIFASAKQADLNLASCSC